MNLQPEAGEEMAKNNLFAYGTLLCEDIMERVSGCRLSYEPATLKDYSRRSVRGEHYPGIIPQVGAFVEGAVYLDVPDSAWQRLDRFEGDMYTRRLVQVELKKSKPLFAATYVVHTSFLHFLEETEWDYTEFLRNGKNNFLRRYKGYQML